MARQNEPEDIQILSLRGGINDSDSKAKLSADECTDATNVEWFYSQIGERRAGTDPLSMTGSGITSATANAVTHLSQWFPTNDVTNPEFWALGATPGNSGVATVLARRVGISSGTPLWFGVTPVDPILETIPDVYNVVTQALNGKLFFAYNSGQDRNHVWDGSGLRRTGLAQPAAPTGADEGVGTYSTLRYFRVRYIKKDGNGTVKLRSEPSLNLKFTPSGSGAGCTVTRPILLNEAETHWEVEASTDNAFFYRIATVSIAISTYNDEIAYGVGYSTGNTLSEAIGAYLLQPACRYLATDGDRLLMAGHFTDPARQSDIWWSTVAKDPGVGNDERTGIVDTGGTNINLTQTLDATDGGSITGITSAMFGSWYTFKWMRIYKHTRTGSNINAYDTLLLTTTRGALPGSVFQGMDENGSACIYFLDPLVGPSRLSLSDGGIKMIRGIRGTWARVNLKAAKVTSRGVYYPYKQQAKWWVAADSNDTPTLVITVQVSELRPYDASSIHRGVSLSNGKYAQALCVSLYNEWVSDGGNITLSSRPFIGLATPDFIQRTDVNTTDNGTAYSASLTTGPHIPSVLDFWGVLSVGVLGTANTGGATVQMRLIRDLGTETTAPNAVSMLPAASETLVFPKVDNLSMSQASAIQIQLSDS